VAALGLGASLLWGCGPPPEPKIVLPPEEPSRPPPALPPPAGEAGSSVPVALGFHNISDLYRGFFSDPRAVEPLQRALAACLQGTADLRIAYEDEKRVGQIVLKLPPAGSRCLPRRDNGGYDLRALEPLGVALAAYRDTVAANFDFRVASFRVGLSFGEGPGQCNLMIAGTHPPDGRRWSPCVGFADQEVCGRGDAKTGVEALSLRGRDEALAACFGS
jgi:hypothetical protein